jgi:hypothetical protein
MMNEPINPYAAAEADLTTPPSEPENLTLPGMRTTGIGLSLVYYGIIMILLTLFVIFLSRMFLAFDRNPRLEVLDIALIFKVSVVTVVLGGLLNFAGQVVCLFVPLQTGAKGFIIAAVIFQIASFFQYILPVVNRLMPDLEIPQSVNIALGFGGILNLLFFVFFMGKLSAFIGRRSLAVRARNMFVLGVILFGILGVMFGGTLAFQNSNFHLLGIPLLIGGLVEFVMYVNLLNDLRKILLGKEPKARKSFRLGA